MEIVLWPIRNRLRFRSLDQITILVVCLVVGDQQTGGMVVPAGYLLGHPFSSSSTDSLVNVARSTSWPSGGLTETVSTTTTLGLDHGEDDGGQGQKPPVLHGSRHLSTPTTNLMTIDHYKSGGDDAEESQIEYNYILV